MESVYFHEIYNKNFYVSSLLNSILKLNKHKILYKKKI